MKYCNNCKQLVQPRKDYSVGLLIILLIFFFIPGVLYYILKRNSCPMCNSDNWGVEKKKK